MSLQIFSIGGLVLIFLLGTIRSVNMGAVALLATFLIGTFVFGESEDDIFGGFPGDLFVVLAGVTFLFAIAKANGTVDWLIHAGVRLVKGRIAFIPWVMFAITSLLTMVGAVVPGAVAIMAPIGLNFASRYRINPLVMGLLIINGASAGGFSPLSIFGSITNGVVERNGLEPAPVALWLASFFMNLALSVVAFFLFGGKKLLGRRINTETNTETEPTGDGGSAPAGGNDGGGGAVATEAEPVAGVTTLNPQRTATLVGLVFLAVGGLALNFDVGLLAVSIAAVLCLIWPRDTKAAVGEIAWPTVLLICGMVTYVSMMERAGTIDFLGDSVAAIGVPLLAALVICVIGGGVSAFASTTGILGALIPLAVPFLQTGQVGVTAMVIALALSSSIVDSSPFSTSGALVTASTPADLRDMVFRRLMRWGLSMIIIMPVVTCLLFVLPTVF